MNKRWEEGEKPNLIASACFKGCYNPSQFSSASSPEHKSLASFFFVVYYVTIFLQNKIKTTHTTHAPPKHLQYMSFHFEPQFFTTEY